MTEFNIGSMPYTTVLYLHSEKDTMQLDPDYQRQSEIWPLEKRQLLIDSIINGYDIPKLYVHKFDRPKTIDGCKYTHAIIDGKQRLTSIWSFIDGKFSLSDDIEYIGDKNVKLRGLTYAELGRQFPRLRRKFDAYPLSIIAIETKDIDLIEDMFSRLNEAVPLSAAEKRNAFGGPLPSIIRSLANVQFCKKKLPFGNKRYRHFDLLAKFLLIEESKTIVDTKKVHLDDLVKRWSRKKVGNKAAKAKDLGDKVKTVMAKMSSVFIDADPLLRSVGSIVLYYHLFRLAYEEQWLDEISRAKFKKFERDRLDNRQIAEKNIEKAEYDLMEYDSYVQTPNDSYAIELRLGVLLDWVFDRELYDIEESK